MALLKAVYNTALRDGLTIENPVRAIKLFREQHRVRFLTEEEEGRLRKAMNPAAWAAVEFAMHTGLNGHCDSTGSAEPSEKPLRLCERDRTITAQPDFLNRHFLPAVKDAG